MPEASEALTALQKIAAAQAAPATRFNTELVRSAWEAIQRRRREARRAAMRSARDLGTESEIAADPMGDCWIKQLWTDHILVTIEGYGNDLAIRIPYTVEAPGTDIEHVKFGKPEKVRISYVAATRGPAALKQLLELQSVSPSDASESVALARVRTMAGARRYRKPIGAQLGTGAPGGENLATVASTGSKEGSSTTSDKLRGAIDAVSKEETYRGGKVFGDIGSEGKLKSALTQIERLPDDKRGEAAAEVVKAAQALGLTSLVPTSIKRLYRQYISQGSSKAPANAPANAPKAKD